MLTKKKIEYTQVKLDLVSFEPTSAREKTIAELNISELDRIFGLMEVSERALMSLAVVKGKSEEKVAQMHMASQHISSFNAMKEESRRLMT